MTTSITEFWNKYHTIDLDTYGFDSNNDNHFSFIGTDRHNEIHSVIILIPFKGIAHHAHICSKYKSKALFKFIWDSLKIMRFHEGIGVIICETQGKPEFEAGDRLASVFGFTPVVTEFGWTDYIWNTKS